MWTSWRILVPLPRIEPDFFGRPARSLVTAGSYVTGLLTVSRVMTSSQLGRRGGVLANILMLTAPRSGKPPAR